MAGPSDAYLYMGGDLTPSATGDILSTDGAERGKQRVLRRLLTNPGDYCWHPTYGGGLGRFVGQPVSRARISGVIRTQMRREDVVARTPAPTVDLRVQQDGSAFADVAYADAASGQTQTLAVPVKGS